MVASPARTDALSVVAGVRRRRAARRVGVLGAVSALPLFVIAADPIAFASLATLTVASFALARSVRMRQGELSIGASSVRWIPADGVAWERPRASLLAGWHEPVAEGQRVVLRFDDGDELIATVDDAAAARELLDRAGVGAAQRAMLFETRSPWARMAWFFGAFVMGFAALMLALVTLFSFMVFPWAGVVMLLPLATTALITVVMLRPVDTMEVLVGADGVTARGEVEDRFVPWGEVESVGDEKRGLVLTLTRGKELLIQGPTIGRWCREALGERIRDALAAHRTAEATARTSALLARGDVPFDVWRDALKARTRAERVYRDRCLDDAELFDVLGDASAPAEQRAAAAMVLASLEDRRDEALTRVRVAVESSASDPLRKALERVLDDALDERAWKRLERAGGRR